MRVEPPALTATIDMKGSFQWTNEEKRAYWALVKELRGQRVEITLRPEQARRSRQANAYYWGVVVKLAVEHINGRYTTVDANEFHEEMLVRFGETKEFDIVDRRTGECRVAIRAAARSMDMRVGDFYQFVEEVRAFVGQELGVETPDPDPLYWRKR